MKSVKFWRLIIRFAFLLGLAGLALLALQPDSPVLAENVSSPPLQDDYPTMPPDDYPTPPDEPTVDPYPGQDTPLPSQPTATGAAPGDTPAPGFPTTPPPGVPTVPGVDTPTPNLSATAELDPFRTEDAEMGGSQGTPTPPGTPGVTATITPSGTAYTATPTADQTEVGEEEAGGFQMDWGLFWIGFSLPIVGACGVVLYLLDRRPDFFRPRRR